jgi:VanZ family protein
LLKKSVNAGLSCRRNIMDKRHKPINISYFRPLFFYGGPVLAYAALIYFLSSLSSFPEEVPSFFGFDKIAHFLEYYFFGFLIYRWLFSKDPYQKRWCALLMTILIGAGYALSDEWHQSFVPGREASLWDALFDAVGAGMGAATYPMIMRGVLSARERLGRGTS